MAAVAKKRKVAKPLCKYGSTCYRKNPQHLQNYRHPGRDDEDESEEEEGTRIEKRARKTEKKTISDYFDQPKGKHESDSGDESDDKLHESKKHKRTTDETGSSAVVDDDDDDGDEDNETEAPISPEDIRENIKSKFLVEMPEDFYQFWEFCKSFQPSNPSCALEKTLSLRLVGPFDILAGKHKKVKKNRRGRRPNFLLHYRFFFDPPEFQTVIAAKEDSIYHLGYYRDDPKESPVFVASNSPAETSKEKLYQCGDNLFAAVHIYATKQMKSCQGDKRKSLEELIKRLEEAASKHSLSLAAISKNMKERQKKVVCATFHGAGIVVPVDANEVGYRPIPETPGDLRAMFKKIAESKTESEREKHFEDLQELITLVQFANDECDYGEGLELGLDLFSFGAPIFHPQIESLLPLAYQLLNRLEFSQIIEAHLKHRRGVTECVDELA